jgi:hypothetical protein
LGIGTRSRIARRVRGRSAWFEVGPPGALTCCFVLHRTGPDTPAPTLQAGGRGFESHRLHPFDQGVSRLAAPSGLRWSLAREHRNIRLRHPPGQMLPGPFCGSASLRGRLAGRGRRRWHGPARGHPCVRRSRCPARAQNQTCSSCGGLQPSAVCPWMAGSTSVPRTARWSRSWRSTSRR